MCVRMSLWEAYAKFSSIDSENMLTKLRNHGQQQKGKQLLREQAVLRASYFLYLLDK